MSINNEYFNFDVEIEKMLVYGKSVRKLPLVMDSRYRHPSRYPNSMNYSLNFLEKDGIFLGTIHNAQNVKRIIAIKLNHAIIHNLTSVFIDTNFNGEDEIKLNVYIPEIRGLVKGPTVDKPFAVLRVRTSGDTARTFVNAEIISGGHVIFTEENPLYTPTLSLLITTEGKNTIDTTLYDGFEIVGYSNGATTIINLATIHNMTPGDKVILSVFGDDDFYRNVRGRTFEILTVAAFDEMEIDFDSTDLPSAPTEWYALRHELQNFFFFDIFESK